MPLLGRGLITTLTSYPELPEELGTTVLIVIIVLVVMMLRRR